MEHEYILNEHINSVIINGNENYDSSSESLEYRKLHI